jgi:hypothetical protein
MNENNPTRGNIVNNFNGVSSAPGRVPTTPQEYLLESERVANAIMERLANLEQKISPVTIEVGARVQGVNNAPESLSLSPLAIMAKNNFQTMNQINEHICEILDKVQL